MVSHEAMAVASLSRIYGFGSNEVNNIWPHQARHAPSWVLMESPRASGFGIGIAVRIDGFPSSEAFLASSSSAHYPTELLPGLIHCRLSAFAFQLTSSLRRLPLLKEEGYAAARDTSREALFALSRLRGPCATVRISIIESIWTR